MFEESPVFVFSSEDKVYRLEMDRRTQAEIAATFAFGVDTMIKGKTGRAFTANYKPEIDEYLSIENFRLDDFIMDAIRNPLGVDSYNKDPNIRSDREDDFLAYPDIKAIFVGERTEDDETEKFNIAYQRFRRDQNIVGMRYRLFMSKETFELDKRFGIGITDNVDCYYSDEKLCFSSFFFARQIFDLSGYYRTATDGEVAAFTDNSKLSFDNAEVFRGYANTYIRRRIAIINDSRVLESYSAREIKAKAKTSGIDIKIKDKKVIVPEDKEDALLVVGFLAEEAYQGPFSQDLFLANSKRVMKKSK